MAYNWLLYFILKKCYQKKSAETAQKQKKSVSADVSAKLFLQSVSAEAPGGLKIEAAETPQKHRRNKKRCSRIGGTGYRRNNRRNTAETTAETAQKQSQKQPQKQRQKHFFNIKYSTTTTRSQADSDAL